MKLLLLCLGLTLVCAHNEEKHDVVTSNFDMAKLSGEWYTVLLASDVKEKIEETGSLRMFMKSFQALDNSSLLIKCHKKINGECIELTFVCDETEEKGVYGVPYDGYNMFFITEAAYNDYLIFSVLNLNNKKKTHLMVLQARNPEVSPELKKRFEELSQEYGIPTENVLDVRNDNPCSQARGSHGAQSSSAE